MTHDDSDPGDINSHPHYGQPPEFDTDDSLSDSYYEPPRASDTEDETLCITQDSSTTVTQDFTTSDSQDGDGNAIPTAENCSFSFG